MLKGVFGKVKCKLGAHTGDWKYSAPGDCTLVRVCDRCGKVNRKVQHSWSDWTFVAVERCDQLRHCQRCSEAENRVSHDWPAPEYRTEGACEQVQRCERCHHAQSAPPVHRWGAAAYVADDRCDQRGTCERCHTSVAAGVAHDWGDWTLTETGDQSARTCRHCGDITRRDAETPAVSSPIPSPPRPSTLAVTSPAPRGWLSPAGIHGKKGDILATLDVSQKEVIAMIGRSEVQTERDSNLLGHWRGTDFLSSGGMSLVTDLHLEFADDGNFIYARQSSGPAGTSPLEMAGEGTWSTSAGALELRWVDRGPSTRRYYVEDGNLLLPDERSWPRIWHAA